ncbi:MAG: glycosyltransferase family 2 protein [Clostridia bacterium]|nr:glycosyltransferase family 2 protein [Clostridia bacterium]
MTIDIICPLYNAEKYIRGLDANIKKQKNVSISKVRYILTKSNDKTKKILDELKATYKEIELQEFSHSLTREQEAFKSKADILVFITQDVVIEKDNWLYNLTKDIENGTVEACYSRQVCRDNSIEKYTRESNYPSLSKIVSKDDVSKIGLKTFFFSDASSAIRKDIFIKLNGYDQKKLPISEDMYIAYKLIMNDYKIKYCADSEVIHSHKFTLKQYYKRYKDTGKFFKENDYFNNYKVNQAGGSLAKYVLKRAWKDKNWSVLFKFMPNMIARFIGMQVGKI